MAGTLQELAFQGSALLAKSRQELLDEMQRQTTYKKFEKLHAENPGVAEQIMQRVRPAQAQAPAPAPTRSGNPWGGWAGGGGGNIGRNDTVSANNPGAGVNDRAGEAIAQIQEDNRMERMIGRQRDLAMLDRPTVPREVMAQQEQDRLGDRADAGYAETRAMGSRFGDVGGGMFKPLDIEKARLAAEAAEVAHNKAPSEASIRAAAGAREKYNEMMTGGGQKLPLTPARPASYIRDVTAAGPTQDGLPMTPAFTNIGATPDDEVKIQQEMMGKQKVAETGNLTPVAPKNQPIGEDDQAALELLGKLEATSGYKPAMPMYRGPNAEQERSMWRKGWYNRVMEDTGGDEAKLNEYVLRAAETKADLVSTSLQTKTIDFMTSYVTNMNSQIDRIEEMGKELERTGVRVANIPMRQFFMKVSGSGDEAIYNAYLTEISNEIGKLSTGSTASIRELSESAQEKWAAIHDPNLSYGEMMKLLKETKHMGELRLASAADALTATKDRIKRRGTKSPVPATPGRRSTDTPKDDPLGIR